MEKAIPPPRQQSLYVATALYCSYCYVISLPTSAYFIPGVELVHMSLLPPPYMNRKLKNNIQYTENTILVILLFCVS